MMTKAHVSPGLRTKTKPQLEQRSSWDHPENSRPSPQCGQRWRSPRQSVVRIKFEREGMASAAAGTSSGFVTLEAPAEFAVNTARDFRRHSGGRHRLLRMLIINEVLPHERKFEPFRQPVRDVDVGGEVTRHCLDRVHIANLQADADGSRQRMG